ncbi:PDZ domain-containing protein [Brevibacillus fulvus]|uniref:PDZ domain-containing protein n=1 Tax=Brevibacillus fulvus TaxID=1125967 RepID=A0A939BT53_9BACL|nr:PDZ domain-containing protein [Brevibacillus fulvus]MBM7591452.1 hypothetical protein [Brevibacillus fulvus]
MTYDGWEQTGHLLVSFGQFFLNPMLYLFVLLIYLHYRKQMLLERQLFAAKLQSPFAQTMRSIGMGLVGGLSVSLVSAGLGIVIHAQDLWMLWILAICLAFVKIRFLCFAYAAGLLGIVKSIASLFPRGAETTGIGTVWNLLQETNAVSLLALVAVLHLAEACLIRGNGGRDASPLFIEGKRGRIIGAYQLHSFWLTPLVLFVQAPEDGLALSLYAGWPLFAEGTSVLQLMFLPAVTGFSDLTQTMTPWEKSRVSSKQLILYALLLLVLAYAAAQFAPLLPIAALFAIFGHEGLLWLSRSLEHSRSPYFIQSSQGVKVMAVIPGTPAAEIGILPGEIIVKVNGAMVKTKEDFYPALQINPAFCKMEVLTHGGEIKFVQCAIYAGNHHQLGIIVVPDSTTQLFVDIRRSSLVQLLKQRLEKLKLGA